MKSKGEWVFFPVEKKKKKKTGEKLRQINLKFG